MAIPAPGACTLKTGQKRMSSGGNAEPLRLPGECPARPCLIPVGPITIQGACQMLFSLKYFFHELCWHPLQSMMLSLCRVSKFQKLSFGSRKCCAKMVLKPGACTAGALELRLPPRGLALLAPSIEHLGSIEGHFEGFGEKVIQVGRSGLVGRAAELSICCNTCQSRHTY